MSTSEKELGGSGEPEVMVAQDESVIEAPVVTVVEALGKTEVTALKMECEELKGRIKELEQESEDQREETLQGFSYSVQNWHRKEAEYREEITLLKAAVDHGRYPTSLEKCQLETVKVKTNHTQEEYESLGRDYEKLKKHTLELHKRHKATREANEAIKKDTQDLYRANGEFAVEVTKGMTERQALKDKVLQLSGQKQALAIEARRLLLQRQDYALQEENKSLQKGNKRLQEQNKTLVADNLLLHQAKEEIADTVKRSMLVCIAAQARSDRTIAALSKIFVEQQESNKEEGITETERMVIDHCLRQLTHEEQAKFLCECGSLDGGFVFRNQVRREMDAIARDPERLAGLMGEQEGTKAPSQEQQQREKRKPKPKFRKR